jgi:PAS domain S-box-containing protein
MMPVPLPDNEDQRLQALRSLHLLDSAPRASFDTITALAADLCQTPIALITLIDSERQWFLSRQGMEDIEQTSRSEAFCAHAICLPDPVMEVSNATTDPRFADNPFVTAPDGVRFYAGAPIRDPEGMALGTLCVVDRRERQLDDAQRLALRQLADLATHLIVHEHDHLELQRRRTEDAARQHELMVAASAAGLDLKSFVDADYIYRYVNRTYLDYWGQQASEIVGKRVASLVGEERFQHIVKARIDRAMAGESVSYEAMIDFPVKGLRHLEVHYLPARDDQGKIVGTVVRAHDVTVLKQREEQLHATVALLEHKDLEQQRFIHIISHDLKEPVNTINNFTDLLVQDFGYGLPPVARRYLDFVHAGGRRMKVLLDDLTDLLVLDKHMILPEPTDLHVLAQQTVQDLQAAIERSGGQVEMAEDLPAINGDPTLLRIVLQNLIANGLKFVAPGAVPRVQISGQRDNDWVRLSVQDNGIGIPVDKQAAIFDMFQRLHSRREYEGTGLGLSICRRIMELHGGHIELHSQPGQGSRFTLHLPTRHPPPQQEAT